MAKRKYHQRVELCEKCNIIITDFLREEFSKMHEGPNHLQGCRYSTFLNRLAKFVEETTGNVNAVMYIIGMIEDGVKPSKYKIKE